MQPNTSPASHRTSPFPPGRTESATRKQDGLSDWSSHENSVGKRSRTHPNFDPDDMKWTRSILKGLAVPAETLEQMRQLAWLLVNRSDFVSYKIGMRVEEVVQPILPTTEVKVAG